MNVVELFYELRMIANVEVVVALLSEMGGFSDQTPRYSLLQRLESIGERAVVPLAEAVEIPTQANTGLEWATFEFEWAAVVRLALEQMNMLRHDHISIDIESVAVAHALKSIFKDSSARVGRE